MSRRRAPRAEQLAGRPRVDRRLAPGDRPDPAEDVVGLGVLEQVADRAGVEGPDDALGVGVRRQHQHVGQLLRRRSRGWRSRRPRRASGGPSAPRRAACARTTSMASAPSLAVPTTSRSSTPASSWSSPPRSTAWSSTTTIVIGSGSLARHRDPTSIRTVVPAPGADRTSSRPPSSCTRLGESPQAEAGRVPVRGRVEADAVVGHDQAPGDRPAGARRRRARWRARAGWRCAPPPGPPARPARPSRRAPGRRRTTDTVVSMSRRGGRGGEVGQRGRSARRRAGRAGGSRRAATAAPCRLVRSDCARPRAGPRAAWSGTAASRLTAVSENAVPARSCTTPSCRSRAIRRRSASEAVMDARSSRSRSRAVRVSRLGQHPDDRGGRRRSMASRPPMVIRWNGANTCGATARPGRRRRSRPRTASARPRATGSGCRPRAGRRPPSRSGSRARAGPTTSASVPPLSSTSGSSSSSA